MFLATFRAFLRHFQTVICFTHPKVWMHFTTGMQCLDSILDAAILCLWEWEMKMPVLWQHDALILLTWISLMSYSAFLSCAKLCFQQKHNRVIQNIFILILHDFILFFSPKILTKSPMSAKEWRLLFKHIYKCNGNFFPYIINVENICTQNKLEFSWLFVYFVKICRFVSPRNLPTIFSEKTQVHIEFYGRI